jgi:DMSO/TMAO reductase YedYZ heme-binding membrane subunit
MSFDLKIILKNKNINTWRLFFLISIPMCIAMIINLIGTDMKSGPGVSSMIQYSVRWAVPFIFLVVAASSVHILFQNSFSAWWLRNRKYIGLCFAVAMSWQGLFIFIMSYFFHDYYYADVYFLRDELEGSIGYIFLPAMVVTSFNFGRKHLSSKQWKLLHKSGIYFLWAYPFSVYWWNLTPYNPDPVAIDYLFYWAGFTAFALRIAAWGKKNQIQENTNGSILYKIFGGLLIALGLFMSATGLYWQEGMTAFLTSTNWSANLELWIPFWPFEPYLSLLVIALGTMLYTKPNDRSSMK